MKRGKAPGTVWVVLDCYGDLCGNVNWSQSRTRSYARSWNKHDAQHSPHIVRQYHLAAPPKRKAKKGGL
jgi:hypothetical protein